MNKRIFDKQNDTPVNAYILENEFIKLELIDYGARINSCIIKKLDVDVVLGFDNMKDILNCSAYIGATIGRVLPLLLIGSLYSIPFNVNFPFAILLHTLPIVAPI